MDYIGTLRTVFTNKAFVIMFMFLGGCMSFISCLATKMEQIMCSVGYSDEKAGLACTIVIIVGAGGTVLFGLMAQKTGKIVEITKLCCFGAIVCVLVMSYLLLMPGVELYIFISAGFLGLFALGTVTQYSNYPGECNLTSVFLRNWPKKSIVNTTTETTVSTLVRSAIV